MVFQRFNLFPHMTAQNVMEAPRQVKACRKRMNARPQPARPGRHERPGRPLPGATVGGQQQRVAIARAW